MLFICFWQRSYLNSEFNFLEINLSKTDFTLNVYLHFLRSGIDGGLMEFQFELGNDFGGREGFENASCA